MSTLYYAGRVSFSRPQNAARDHFSPLLPHFSIQDLKFPAPRARTLFKLWLTQLRLKAHRQTFGRLRLQGEITYYDPLGLLVQLYLKAKVSTRFEWVGDHLLDLHKGKIRHARLPRSIRKFFGLSKLQMRKIIYMNDNQRLSFHQIATLLSV